MTEMLAVEAVIGEPCSTELPDNNALGVQKETRR
jgi:hypothetical protein